MLSLVHMGRRVRPGQAAVYRHEARPGTGKCPVVLMSQPPLSQLGIPDARVSCRPSFHPYLPLNKVCMQLKKIRRGVILHLPSRASIEPSEAAGSWKRNCTLNTLYLRPQPACEQGRLVKPGPREMLPVHVLLRVEMVVSVSGGKNER